MGIGTGGLKLCFAQLGLEERAPVFLSSREVGVVKMRFIIGQRHIGKGEKQG